MSISWPRPHSGASIASAAWRSTRGSPVRTESGCGCGRRQPRLVLPVHEQAPDLLVRDVADEILDVDPAVAERAALLVGLGDLSVERDHSLETRRNLYQRHGVGEYFPVLIRLATEEDAADVARLMIAFRDWWGRDEPDDATFEAGVRRLLADPNTDFLLAGDPAIGVCQLRYRFAVWTGTEDCCLEDVFVEEEARGAGVGRALIEAAFERARERGCARIDLDTNETNTRRSGYTGRWDSRAGRGPARRAQPAYAAASLTSSTSSPTSIRPGWTMSARRPARCTMPLRTPGIGERLDVRAGLAPLGADGLDAAYAEALAQQVVQPDPAREHLTADLRMGQLDAGVLAKALERLRLDQRDVAAPEVAVARQALGGHVDALDGLGQLLALGGDSDGFHTSRHDAQSTLTARRS